LDNPGKRRTKSERTTALRRSGRVASKQPLSYYEDDEELEDAGDGKEQGTENEESFADGAVGNSEGDGIASED
jgi:hypothetical protein